MDAQNLLRIYEVPFPMGHFWEEGGHAAAVAVAAAMKEEDPVHQISAVAAFVGEVVGFLVAQ